MTIKSYPTLYKKTTTGATQIWYMEQDNEKFRTISGQIDGKKVFSGWTTAESTNVGRSNERNPEQQAQFEIEAEYKKKLDKDYHNSLETIDQGAKIFKCMLAEKYQDRLTKKELFEYKNIFSQPKLDGMRCIADKNGLWTRNGKAIVSCPHIVSTLKPFFDQNPDAILDGELYNHEFKSDFNSLMSMFKKTKPLDEDFKLSFEFGQFHVYDITMHGNALNPPFITRYTKLIREVQKINSPHIRLVETIPITSKDMLDQAYIQYMENGYEGQMIRQNTPYENKRTWNLLKRKEMQDIEATLKGIKQGKGNWEGKARIGEFVLDNGIEFEADITGTMEFCQQVFENKEKYLEKRSTIVFQNFTPDGKPRFGKAKELDRIDI